MANLDVEMIKKLREETGAGFADCRKAVEESKGDYKIALSLIQKWGIKKSEKKVDRETRQGIVEAYIHATGRVGVLLTLLCETDFVAQNAEFKKLAHEIGMQIASMNPKTVQELLDQPYIRDAKMKVEDLVRVAIGRIGENIRIGDFVRYEI